MDCFYYSNHCRHCKSIIQYLVKNGLTEKLNFICIDKRKIDTRTQQIQVVLENGQMVALPPNIASVPALLLTKQNYRAVVGEPDIIEYFKPFTQSQTDAAVGHAGEPVGFSLGSLGEVVSENFTFYDMTAEELSAKGVRNGKQMFNYTAAGGGAAATAAAGGVTINTPPNTYKSERMTGSDEFEAIRKERSMAMI